MTADWSSVSRSPAPIQLCLLLRCLSCEGAVFHQLFYCLFPASPIFTAQGDYCLYGAFLLPEENTAAAVPPVFFPSYSVKPSYLCLISNRIYYCMGQKWLISEHIKNSAETLFFHLIFLRLNL